MSNVTYIKPGLTDPVNLSTHGDRNGFSIMVTTKDKTDSGVTTSSAIINLNYIEAVKVFEDIKEWLESDQGG